jgi:hypothetical protein
MYRWFWGGILRNTDHVEDPHVGNNTEMNLKKKYDWRG